MQRSEYCAQIWLACGVFLLIHLPDFRDGSHLCVLIGDFRARNYSCIPGVGGKIILRLIFRKWDVGVWTGSRWLRIGTGGSHLWMR